MNYNMSIYVHDEQRAKENLQGNRTFSKTKGIPLVCSGLFLDSLSFALLPLRLLVFFSDSIVVMFDEVLRICWIINKIFQFLGLGYF